MKFSFYSITLIIILCAFLSSCNKNVAVKIIEEHDPVVKIIEERDSMVVYPADTAKLRRSKSN